MHSLLPLVYHDRHQFLPPRLASSSQILINYSWLACMSSPVRVLEPDAPISRGRNAKRRILSDSEDAEDRDPKRVKPQETVEDQWKGRDLREKRKRRKKRRKMSMVESALDSEPESPTIATKPTLSRVRSRSTTTFVLDTPTVSSPGQSTLDDTRQPSAGPSSMLGLKARAESPLEDMDQSTPLRLAPFTVRGAISLPQYALRLYHRLLRPLRALTRAKGEQLQKRLSSRMSRSSYLTFRSK